MIMQYMVLLNLVEFMLSTPQIIVIVMIVESQNLMYKLVALSHEKDRQFPETV